MHGVHFTSRDAGRLPTRLIWFVLVLAMLAANSVHLGLLIGNYFQYNTNVNVYLDEQAPDFPELVICNTNPVNRLFMLPPVSHSVNVLTRYVDIFERFNDSFNRDHVSHKPNVVSILLDNNGMEARGLELFQDNYYFNCYRTSRLYHSQKFQMLRAFIVVDKTNERVEGGVYFDPWRSGISL